ncbi:putative MFS transporter [Amycolatopsis bartoniae]|uniref:MFS transporter n=1 Tax=Amycolatopsis bartoniae TaxID=941986 RepID=A0A8H9MAI3_9PSEU|nr:MFS transporter [Amycolatopsis bartoniae]MBB2940155.1 putative MFS transporter [Amycolatopsis bartoniae]GHF36906.1 MFS transporter [Amycolatopsis bartoniae]
MSTVPTHVPEADLRRGARVNQLLDDAPRVGLSALATFGLLLTYLFANYDISVVTITFPSISRSLGLHVTDLSWPVTANLVGYAIGAYLLGHLADRRGRLAGLRGTVAVLGASGLLTAMSWNLWSFTLFRFLCGCGMGAVLALASAYVGELAPKNRRGRYLTTIYLMQAVLLTLIGFGSLPVLDLGPAGWRILIAFGALVLVVLFLLGDRVIPESPRWLAARGQLDRAERITERLAARSYRHAQLPPEGPATVAEPVKDARTPLAELLRRPMLGRVALITGFWFFFYVGFYGFSSYQPLLLEGLGARPAEAIWLTVIGRISGVLSCLLLFGAIERFERRTIIVLSAGMTLVSYLLLVAGSGPAVLVVANLLFTFAIGIMVPPAFTYTAEIFPTHARGTAAAIGDGVGHLGGAVAPFVVLPVLSQAGAHWAMWTIIATMVVATTSVALGPRTKDRSLAEISVG